MKAKDVVTLVLIYVGELTEQASGRRSLVTYQQLLWRYNL